MKRSIVPTSVAVLFAAATLAAQPPAKPPAQAEGKAHGINVTLTGCVAPGTGSSQYLLTNVVRDVPATDNPRAREKAATGQGAMKHPMTYTLVGGTDLKAHVGHKVEVTGTLVKPGPKAAEEKAAGTPKPSANEMPGGAVTVTAVKMIAATCP